MRKKHNDPRAAHAVYVFPYATNVKFTHRGYTISLAADGQETIVFDGDKNIAEFSGTSALAVYEAVNWINQHK